MQQDEQDPPAKWRTTRAAAKRAEIARTRQLLASYRQQQDAQQHVLRAARASLLGKQAEELRRQRPTLEPEGGDSTCRLDTCTAQPTNGNQSFGFAAAPAPTFHLHPGEDHPAQDLTWFLYESGLSKEEVEGLLLDLPSDPAVGAHGGTAGQDPSSGEGLEGSQSACSERRVLAGLSEQRLGLPLQAPAMAVPQASLLAVAERRINAWEVRRLLACRDCSSASQLQRWCLALRVPLDRRFGAAGSSAQAAKDVAQLVQQSRQYLLLRVHPDKNSARDSGLAAAAFTFLQEASEGLQAHLN